MSKVDQAHHDELRARYDDVYTALVEAARLVRYALERTRIESPRMDGSDWGTKAAEFVLRADRIEFTEPK